MAGLFWLIEQQIERINPFFRKERGVNRADDRKVLSGIVYVIKNGLLWVRACYLWPAQDALQNPPQNRKPASFFSDESARHLAEP